MSKYNPEKEDETRQHNIKVLEGQMIQSHTPTPWKQRGIVIDCEGSEAWHRGFIICAPMDVEGVATANAAYIVKAVNERETLLALLASHDLTQKLNYKENYTDSELERQTEDALIKADE